MNKPKFLRWDSYACYCSRTTQILALLVTVIDSSIAAWHWSLWRWSCHSHILLTHKVCEYYLYTQLSDKEFQWIYCRITHKKKKIYFTWLNKLVIYNVTIVVQLRTQVKESHCQWYPIILLHTIMIYF